MVFEGFCASRIDANTVIHVSCHPISISAFHELSLVLVVSVLLSFVILQV